MKRILLIALLGLILNSFTYAQQGLPFANEVKEYQHQDSLHFPKPGGILFIGSSSIRRWTDIGQRFAGLPVINRGLGGSELWQWVSHYTPYVVLPYRPAKIFVYAGENDLAGGKSAAYVAEQFTQLWQIIREKLPDAEIYFIGIKQSPSRAKYYNDVLQANKLIKNFIANKPKTQYIDMNIATLKPGTTVPDSSLFLQDMLHLKSVGYDKWQAVLQPYVK